MHVPGSQAHDLQAKGKKGGTGPAVGGKGGKKNQAPETSTPQNELASGVPEEAGQQDGMDDLDALLDGKGQDDAQDNAFAPAVSIKHPLLSLLNLDAIRARRARKGRRARRWRMSHHKRTRRRRMISTTFSTRPLEESTPQLQIVGIPMR